MNHSTDSTSTLVYGLRPVLEALEAGKTIDRILIRKNLDSELAAQIFERAKAAAVLVQRVPVEKLNRITHRNHQGVIAQLPAVDYCQLDQVVQQAFDEGRNPFVVVLDGVTDVRNFGAIARTCECAGVDAIVIPERNSVTVTPDAVKTSAGALNIVPVCREHNLAEALRYLRNSGLTVVGTSDRNATRYTSVDMVGPVALVLGGEDHGISTDVAKLCHHHVVIPEFGQINSLNVSVAAGIVTYEVVRQRLNEKEL